MNKNNNFNQELLSQRAVYVQDLLPNQPSKLYTLNLETGKAEVVG